MSGTGQPDIYTVAEAALEVGINPKNLLHWIGRGSLKATKKGRMFIIHRADLDAFQRSRAENVRVQGQQRQNAAP